MIQIKRNYLKALMNEAYEQGKNDSYYKCYIDWRDDRIKELKK